jgi:hypothetical protein
MRTPDLKLSLWDKLKLVKNHKTMLAKLTSRKLWAALVGAFLAAFGQGLGLDPASVQWAASILVAYILGESHVDSIVQQTKALGEKLLSRKLWAAAIGTTLVALGTALDLPESATQWLATIVITYIGGQSYVDAKKLSQQNAAQ